MAVENFKNRGYATLGGLILNRRNVPNEDAKVQELAEDFHTKIIGTLSHSPLVTEAENQGRALMACYPDSPMATEYEDLASRIYEDCQKLL